MSIRPLAGSIQLLVGAVVLAGLVAPSAQILPPGPPTLQKARPGDPVARSFRLDSGKPPSKDPYARLFSLSPGQSGLGRSNAVEALKTTKPKTVCGLTIWNVEPDLDPRSLLRPRGPRVDYKIGKLAPPVCVE
jgi:hypothetical protein